MTADRREKTRSKRRVGRRRIKRSTALPAVAGVLQTGWRVAALACGRLQAGEVGVGVGGGAGALGGVQGFGQRLEGDVQGVVAVHAGGEALHGGADAGGLVDGKLFFNRQMQREVQKRVGLPVFDGKITFQHACLRERGVVFGMFGDDAGGELLHGH